ncbi:unnamed protein product [Spirodela intermedia]|uniref:Uncharacterized protein n=1 Tax=Spirodela intermedia TaxID=51605 RepID=A0A7I8JKE2_SPIIN|nr:unnamed protein product [Spirodela intermedia]CAA6670624.1 unnamed protein product [Spirodela intermedia]
MAVPPASAASSPYVTPFVINLPEGGAVGGGGSESGRKWGWQGLDLNAGPGGVEIEAREGNNRSALTSRQLSVAGSQAFAEEKQVRMYQAAVSGGVLKRKEPEGGWDPDKFTYRQPPWQ